MDDRTLVNTHARRNGMRIASHMMSGYVVLTKADPSSYSKRRFILARKEGDSLVPDSEALERNKGKWPELQQQGASMLTRALNEMGLTQANADKVEMHGLMTYPAVLPK